MVRSPLTDLEAPRHSHSLCFWGEEDTYNHVECEHGQGVRLKTRGDSLLIGKINMYSANGIVSRSQTILGEGLVDWDHIVRSGSLDIGEQEVMTFCAHGHILTHGAQSITHDRSSSTC